jgi:hypothetical protein
MDTKSYGLPIPTVVADGFDTNMDGPAAGITSPRVKRKASGPPLLTGFASTQCGWVELVDGCIELVNDDKLTPKAEPCDQPLHILGVSISKTRRL